MKLDVLVIGSINCDTRVVVQQLPRAGETISGSNAVVSGGGKGANQAVAAARTGATVAIVGAIGDDEDGRTQVGELELHGVDVGSVRAVPGIRTGSAFICVDSRGENLIVISPGANAYVDATPAVVRHAAKVVLVQNEIPDEALAAASAFASASHARLVVNAAPVPASIPAYFREADPLVVNEHEAADLLGGQPVSSDEVAHTLQRATGARSVIVTLGAEGSVVHVDGSTVRVPGVHAELVVDTTGAGDTFVGVLAARLAAGDELVPATHEASRAASISVGWVGARPAVA